MIFGLSMGLGLYVYYAAWTMPVLVIAFGAYLLIFDQERFKRAWAGLAVALVIAGVIFFPLGWELAHGPRVTRIEVTGAPFRALLQGDPRPVIETTLGTLGMFTFAGDPEWLYNFSGLPLFDWIAGMAFYLGVLICLLRLRETRYGFVLAWLVVGLSPAFISVPPGSYSHTFAAQGAVYLLPALALNHIPNTQYRIPYRKWVLGIGYLAFVAWMAWYTYHYYFDWWPNHAMVRFQYHADTRDLARWLDAQPTGGDIAISTTGTQLAPRPLPLEPLALSLDLRRQDVALRWFDGAWALVFPNGGGGRIALLSFPHLNSLLEPSLPGQIAEYHNPPTNQLAFRVYQDAAAPGSRGTASVNVTAFDSRLTLLDAEVPVMPREGSDGFLLTTWRVDGSLNAPLKIFAHLLDSTGQIVGSDDRLDALIESLRPGDVFVQISRLPRLAGVTCSPCRVRIGVYNPETGQRLQTPTGDSVLLLNEVRP